MARRLYFNLRKIILIALLIKFAFVYKFLFLCMYILIFNLILILLYKIYTIIFKLLKKVKYRKDFLKNRDFTKRIIVLRNSKLIKKKKKFGFKKLFKNGIISHEDFGHVKRVLKKSNKNKMFDRIIYRKKKG